MRRLILMLGVGSLIAAGILLMPPSVSRVRAAVRGAPPAGGEAPRPTEAMHTERGFEFTVKLPIEAAAPLFGADLERKWAPGWSPEFIWPAAARDRQGMVFTIARGGKKIIWIATKFDIAEGSFQYAYVVPEVMVTLITLKLTPQDQWTHVAVQYDRTSLSPAGRDVVIEMAGRDSESGPEWEKQIGDYINGLPK